MFSSLRARLLFSYTLVVGLTLCIIALALSVLLRRSPLPLIQTYDDLNTIAREELPTLRDNPDQINVELQRIADENDIRVLHFARNREVLFDSSGEYQAGERFLGRITANLERQPDSRGIFQDDTGEEWVFMAFNIRGPGGQEIIIFAIPRSQISLFQGYGRDLLMLLFQAGLIALIVSVLLALLISRSIVRPLRGVVRAANAIAEGDYDQHAPEDGPREVRELGSTFNHMVEQVQRARQTQRDFLANVSHELKTPLTSIQGYSQAILDGAASRPTHAAQVIYDEAGRMHRLVEDLLDLARIESGQTVLRRDYLDLTELLIAVTDRLAIRAQENQVALGHEIAIIPRFTGDPDRLAQVFTNLIDNALAHTPQGGQVMVRAHAANGGVQVVIQDTGKGIPREDLERIFERFYQVDKSRARAGKKGTGLGLAICKEIVEVHGGTIKAESPAGQGAIFTIWLPLPRHSDETVHSQARQSR